MKRSQVKKYALNSNYLHELSKKTAIHEAGHAAAIYFNNTKKKLPPVFFQIIIKQVNTCTSLADNTSYGLAHIDGGKLIHTLPFSVEAATREFTVSQKQAYLTAFEADMINLLAGSLAEAYYVALRDDKTFNPRIISINALKSYGGEADIKLVNDYLACYSMNSDLQTQKRHELFIAAFNFIHNQHHWQRILHLSQFILTQSQAIIDYEAIVSALSTAESFTPVVELRVKSKASGLS